ncbi:MAG: YdcF family protein [Eubacteriales bacterium]|nr:YdcF family protein [Eubacteriales bacterium]MDD4718145.1 YdcF family protein [Eubacteriales bacterium]
MRKILLTIGILLFADFLVLAFITNFHTGIALQGIAAVLIIMYAVFFERIKRKIHISIISILIIPIIFITVIAVYGNTDNADYTEDTVIVLGSGINGEKVSPKLAKRLEAAIRYHTNNPDAMIVVCGGKGDQEDITEALAMERYLLSEGIPGDIIIREEKSTSTYENILFAGNILKDRFAQGFSSVIITSDYHIYRAVRTAHNIGYQAEHISTITPCYTVVADYLREMTAIIYLWLFPR